MLLLDYQLLTLTVYFHARLRIPTRIPVMFFSGEAGSKPRVNLSGRSRLPDRQQLLEQSRLEREKRLRVRLLNQSALRIQSWYRGRSLVAKERSRIRADWQASYGECGELATREDFWTSRTYVVQLLFITMPSDLKDLERLASACKLLLGTFATTDTVEIPGLRLETGSEGLWKYRMQRLALLCLEGLNHHRSGLRDKLLQPWGVETLGSDVGSVLLETLVQLTGKGPWTLAVLNYLSQHRMFVLLRNLLLLQEVEVEAIARGGASQKPQPLSALEHSGFLLVMRHIESRDSNYGESEMDRFMYLQLAGQLGSIPYLWDRFPSFIQTPHMWRHFVETLNLGVTTLNSVLPPHVGGGMSPKTFLLGNVISGSSIGLVHPSTTRHTAICFAGLTKQLLEALVEDLVLRRDGADEDNGDMEDTVDVQAVVSGVEPALGRQLAQVADSSTLQHLVRLTMSKTDTAELAAGNSDENTGHRNDGVEVCESLGETAPGLGVTCAMLDTALTVFPRLHTTIVTGLAWQACLVPLLWAYIKSCQLKQSWFLPPTVAHPQDAGSTVTINWLGWILPLALFCPVYSYILFTVDNEEFYVRQTPLSLADLKILVEVLRDAVWRLLWASGGGRTSVGSSPSPSLLGSEPLKRRVASVSARLLSQLHDRNCMQEFTRPELFHAPEGLSEEFYSQAEQVNTKANQLLQEAPFLVPFPGRVRIFNNLLQALRAESGPALLHGGIRITIRRDRIVEDSFAQLHSLPAEALRNKIRVQYVNELGAEEAGVDGGGMFKDFLENITRTAFDVQHGLFKETNDHLLYPNPASELVMPNHLQYFEFLGRILGKALLEGILVDIRFAKFFLSKLRTKQNYLHDLPSLDPELYRNLMFLKNYEGNVADLELFFVVEDTAFGKVVEVELDQGGKDIPVTSSNVIRYVWLVANHHLNRQIQQQSRAFLRGLQDVVPSSFLKMFNEQELQMLISGSEEGMDLEDLRQHATYSGGYSEGHPVIRGLWEVLQSFDLDLQHKFLKFVTGCSRGPLLGFRHLEPAFCVQRAGGDRGVTIETTDRLPTAATCLNLLKLPPYRSVDVIREKLLYAITAGAGFDLS